MNVLFFHDEYIILRDFLMQYANGNHAGSLGTVEIQKYSTSSVTWTFLNRSEVGLNIQINHLFFQLTTVKKKIYRTISTSTKSKKNQLECCSLESSTSQKTPRIIKQKIYCKILSSSWFFSIYTVHALFIFFVYVFLSFASRIFFCSFWRLQRSVFKQ